jgi:3D (Asp-Asp-Asp) domain-containing protein
MSFGLVGTVGFAAYITACKLTRPLTSEIKGREISVTEIKKEEYITTSFPEEEKWINVIVSYYSNTLSDCGKTDGIGANNIKLNRGHIAMPKEFEFGTKLYLEGMGVFENQDTGGAIKRINGNTIKVDMYIPNASRKYLKELGIKRVRGKIIK